MTVAEALKNGASTLVHGAVPEPARESSLLLEFALQRTRAFLIAYPEYELVETEAARFQEVLDRRASHEPYQYIVGKQEFYGLDFTVTPDVLIPRPETEMLVERSIELLRDLPSPSLLEIGVGSGCIAVSILRVVQNAEAIGVDISEAAIRVAKSNAEHQDVDDRLRLGLSNVYEGIPSSKFDLIVSNPPYVPFRDIAGLQAEVRDHEPHNALSDGGDGLSIIKKIIHGAPQYMKSAGWLLIEIGMGQSENVLAMFNPEIWEKFEARPDFQGIPRMVLAQLK
jgi:release factor glutamine methyltransferase